MVIINTNCYKGTRIVIDGKKRAVITNMAFKLMDEGYQEVYIPIIQHAKIFEGKLDEENDNLMFFFEDRGGRDLCLAPEYTAVLQALAQEDFKHKKDVKLFYVAECFRGEKPQGGRYRQFTQLGVEILNPTRDHTQNLITLAKRLVAADPLWLYLDGHMDIQEGVTRGQDYYTPGSGFEFTCDRLGAQKQILGGGSYQHGQGFAIGIDRLLHLVYSLGEDFIPEHLNPEE